MRLFLVGDQRERHRRGVAEPVPRGRHLAVVDLADVGDELVDAGNARLLPVPFEHPDADARLRRQRLQQFQLLLRAGDVDLLVDAELHDLLEAVDHVGALHQQDQHVRIGGARLDQIGGEIGGAERGQLVAGDGAAELLQIVGAGVMSVWPKA